MEHIELITTYWSRTPGRFLNRHTGQETRPTHGKTEKRKVLKEIRQYEVDGLIPRTVVKVFEEREEEVPLALVPAPCFMGSLADWYGILIEEIFSSADNLEKKHIAEQQRWLFIQRFW